MKLLFFLLFFSLSLLAKDIVLIIQTKTQDSIKHQAIQSTLSTLKKQHPNYLYEIVEVDYKFDEDIQKLNDFITKNKQEIVYIVAPNNTSEYKKIASFLPTDIPILTGVGTAMVLNKKDTWVVTTSALSKGKAIAIQNLLRKNKTQDLLVIFEDTIDEYTQEIIEFLSEAKIDILFMNSNDLDAKEFQVPNRLIFVATKTNKHTTKLYDKINAQVLQKHTVNNDILLLKVAEKDKSHFSHTQHIYFLSYDIPGYLPDFRLDIYDNVDAICDSHEISTSTCFKIYGTTYQKLFLALDLGLYNQKKNQTTHEVREEIYKNLIQYNKNNTYYNQETKQIMQFKKETNYYYNSLIENGITNYYIVRLDKQKDYLNSFQINAKSSLSKDINSQNTVYLDYKLEQLEVTDLSASSVHLEGVVRIVSTIKNLDLKKDFQINFNQNLLTHSSIKLIDKNEYFQDGEYLYESFYETKGYFNIDTDLWMFPYDKQKVYISFTAKDFVNNPFIVQLQDNEEGELDFGEWKVDYIKPFLSNEVVKFEKNILLKNNSIFYKSVSNLEMQITRNTSFAIIMKFILPVIIILGLILVTFFMFHKKSTLDSSVDIYISSFGGIISIYFIFNLLIDIENLIIFDIAFLVFMAISIVFIILNIMRYDDGILKAKHRK